MTSMMIQFICQERERREDVRVGLLNDDDTSDDGLMDVDILKVSVVTILKSSCEKSNIYVRNDVETKKMWKECK